MDIPRLVQQQIEAQIGKQKVVLLYGTRRTGKSTIVENIADKYPSSLLLQGEDLQIASLLQDRTLSNYVRLIAGKKLIIIDEAQAVPNIGMILKFIIDNIKGITIIATGSSSFDLQSFSGEPLVGRSVVFTLYPIAQIDLSQIEDYLTTTRNLEQRLIYGSYPELWHLNEDNEKEIYLKHLVNSYLLKDIFSYEKIKGADILYRLLQMLAWQVGSEVNTVELGNSLQISRATVDRYLDLLSKVFIIFPLSGYSNNLRKEISKRKKWFFYDNGIRNAIISNFNPLAARNDVGQLWEQYILSERIKANTYHQYFPQYFFWRTYDNQEIDFLELDNKQHLKAMECKWGNAKIKKPTAFLSAYPNAVYDIINQQNYLDWVAYRSE
jgi:predicted AAA+ superfamily ATPase